MSHSHDWIDEWESRLISWGIKVRHWYGWVLKCPLYNNEMNRHPLIAKLKYFKIPTKNICTICQSKGLYPQKQCPYHKQFINLPKVVIAPIEYAFTKYVDDFGPKYIVVDDCLRRSAHLHTIEELEEFLKQIQNYNIYMPEYEKITFRELLKMNEEDFETFMKKLKEEYERNMIAAAKSLADFDDSWMPFLTFRPEEIEAYYRCRKMLGKLKAIDTPALFPLFDYIATTNAEMTIVEARFNDRCMELWKKRYRKETRTTIIFVPKNIKLKFEDKGSVVYQIKAHTWFAPGQLKNNPKLRLKIQNHIGWVKNDFHKDKTAENIGMVHSKKFDKVEFIPHELINEREDLKALHFGNLCGQNLLAKCTLGLVIGTYVTEHRDLENTGEGIIEKFKRIFVKEPSTIEYVDDKPHGGYYHFEDEDLDAWRWLHEEYEQYQAVHRFRPLIHKSDIYVYGLVPKEIREELTVKKFSFKIGGDKLDEKTKWLIEYVKENNNCVPVKVAKYDLRNKFKIGNEWARVMMNKIVTDIDELQFSDMKDLKYIIYK